MATNRELTIQVIKLQEKLDRLIFELTKAKTRLIGIEELKQQLLTEIASGTDPEQMLCIVADRLGKITKSETFGELVKTRLEIRNNSTNKE